MENNQRVVDSAFDRLQARNGLSAKNQSQMTKLLPILSMAGKPEEDKVLTQAKLEGRVAAIQEFLTLVLGLIPRVSNLAELSLNQRSSRVTQTLRTLNGVRPVPGSTKAYRAAVNELQSIREGIRTDHPMDDEDYSVVMLDKLAQKLLDLRITTNKALADLHKPVDEIPADDKDEALYADFASVLASAQEEAKSTDLASIKDREWTVVRAPVIPMAKGGIMEVSKFVRAGINCTSMAGYPMFRNQLIVGINRHMLDESKPGAPIPREALFKAASRVKRILERKTGQRLQFVDDRPHGAQGGSWFWLMPERELDAFAMCCPGQRVQLLNWGFAFN